MIARAVAAAALSLLLLSTCTTGFVGDDGAGIQRASNDQPKLDQIRIPPRSQNAFHVATSNAKDGENSAKGCSASRVAWISSKNLGGVTDTEGREIKIDFPNTPNNFAACTGETGSGKSLLLARAAELLSGIKTSPGTLGIDMRSDNTQIYVGIEFWLNAYHRSLVKTILDSSGFGDCLGEAETFGTRVRCTRRIMLQTTKAAKKFRLKSLCEVNGRQVTLQLLSAVVSPLLSVVDGTKAASALAKAEIRTSILDATIPGNILADVVRNKQLYRSSRKEREQAELSIKNRILPKGFSLENEEDSKLLAHWVDELNAFKTRVLSLCASFEALDSGKSGVLATCKELASCQWMDNGSSDENSFSSAIYDILSGLREKLKALDRRLHAASNAASSLALLSTSESVLTALERARRFVDEAAEGDDNLIAEAVERSHDLLNDVETAAKRCAHFIEDDTSGLLQRLEDERSACPVSVELIEEILLDWATLARKHGVAPSSLPSCHQSLLREQRGSNEALELLPQLLAIEQRYKGDFTDSCRKLSQLRHKAARQLADRINERLPSLGMEPTFDVIVDSRRLEFTDKLMSSGPDDVDFVIGRKSPNVSTEPSQGLVHEVASSGEKARVLLAIECAVPGSVAACVKRSSDAGALYQKRPMPVLVLYDEIDAHVGGYAATAVATMLVEQSRTNQVVAITHSPAVAAFSNHHILVKKLSSKSGSHHASVTSLSNKDRTQELARMASGNLATDAAEAFADALLQDGANMRNGNVTRSLASSQEDRNWMRGGFQSKGKFHP